MEPRNFWIFDDFYAEARQLRQKIDDHFDEKKNRLVPLSERLMWNYWYVNKRYIYMRTVPERLFGELYSPFMGYLRRFVAINFGLVCHSPSTFSMYINGCGQTLHNDAQNGRLAYVYSLTKWDNRRSEGGETQIFKNNASQRITMASHMESLNDLVDSRFNRLLLFDDRVPHAVRPVQGTMDPQDARFVLHGHFLDSLDDFAYKSGMFYQVNTRELWQQLRVEGSRILQSHHYHGFVTFQLKIEGEKPNVTVKHAQLMPLNDQCRSTIEETLEEMLDYLYKCEWPEGNQESMMVFAIASHLLIRQQPKND